MKRSLFYRRSLPGLLGILFCILLKLLIQFLISHKAPREPIPDPQSPELRPTPRQDDTLAAMLEDFCASHEGKWDLYVFNLSRGEFAAHSQFDGEMPVSASLIKLFIMAAAYAQIQADQLFYQDVKYEICNMIARSDNRCTNLVIKHLGHGIPEQGFAQVNAYTESIGCRDTKLNRLMLDNNGLQNYTTAADCAALLRMLYRYELAAPVYTDDMLDWLKMQTVNDRIPVLLPEGTVCAHKTGDLIGLSHGDVGIIFSPCSDYIFCAICNGTANDQAAINAISELSLAVYNYFNPDKAEMPSELPS